MKQKSEWVTSEVSLADWLASAELCAMDVAFWSDNGEGLSLNLLANDIFGPGADAETVPVAAVQEVLEIAHGEPDYRQRWRPLMEWVARRRGYMKGMEWFCDRKRGV